MSDTKWKIEYRDAKGDVYAGKRTNCHEYTGDMLGADIFASGVVACHLSLTCNRLSFRITETPKEWAKSDERMFADIRAELLRARAKFPGNVHRLAAFGEEAGELTKAVLDHEYGEATAVEVYAEAVQAAAMAIRVAVEGDKTFTYKPYLEQNEN